MHVQAAHHVSMPHEGASRTMTPPDAPTYFLFPPTYRTPARCSLLRTGEALHVGLFGLIGEIGNVFAVFPLAHTLVMMAPAPPIPDPMGIADEERADAMLLTEGDDRSRALVPQVADLSTLPGAHFPSCSLKFPIPPRAFLAPVAFLGDLAQGPVMPPLEAANAPA